ncbi:MAG: hypothetical protein E6Q98_15055 [Rhodospirillaceae bacterium]|nr:MAG: hypothetical protein E6Q98_15055 [Rhodospirillaceae bacterium]
MKRFLVEALRGIDLDETQSHQEERPDYECLGGLLIVELKSLEEDGSTRMGNLIEELGKRADWPQFLGPTPIKAFIQHTDEPEAIARKVSNRIGRAVVNHMKKANRQLGAYRKEGSRRNIVGALVFVNEDHEIYDPQLVGRIIAHELRRMDAGNLLYPNIDLVFYFTERHVQIDGRQVLYPCVVVEGQRVNEAPWMASLSTCVLEKWSSWNGHPFIRDGTATDFTTIDAIPEMAPKHERWRTGYRRNPYLRTFDVSQLRDRFDEIMVVLNHAFIKGSPWKPPRELIERSFEAFTHLTLEMSERAIPASNFRLEVDRLAAAAERLKLTDESISWLKEMDSEK